MGDNTWRTERGPVVETEPVAPNQSSTEDDMASSKSTRSPAFQFYPKDFLSSTKVQRMSLTEVGVYMFLLSYEWLNSGIPTDVTQIARIVKVPAPRFRRMWAGPLSECFIEKNGRLVNPRLEQERRVQADYRKKQKDNAARGWQSRRNAVASPPHMPKTDPLSPIPDLRSASTKDQRETGDGAAYDGQAMFASLLAEYPPERITHDHPTQVAFLEAVGPPGPEMAERFALMRRTLSEHKASEQWRNPRFAPNLITWLKRGDWRGTRKLELAATGTEGRGRTGAPVRGKYDGIEEHD